MAKAKTPKRVRFYVETELAMFASETLDSARKRAKIRDLKARLEATRRHIELTCPRAFLSSDKCSCGECTAHNAADLANKNCRESNGEEPGEDDDGRVSAGPWEQVPDEQLFTVRDEDTGQRHVFPASWWANNDPDASPHGFVASTEY